MATDGIRIAVGGGGLAGLAAAHPATLGATRAALDGTAPPRLYSGLISEEDGPVKRHKSAVRGGVDSFRASGPRAVLQTLTRGEKSLGDGSRYAATPNRASGK